MKTPLNIIRSSSAPLCYECGQAAVPAQHPCGLSASASGSIGDALHALLAELVHLDIDQTDVEGLIVEKSNSHACDANEVRFLTHWSLDHWKQIKEDFPDPITELEMSAPLPGGKWGITGHPDVISIIPSERLARVLDYKSGRDPGNYLHQLMAYAYLIIYNDRNIDTVRVTQLDVRSSRANTRTFQRAEIMEWAQYYADRLDDKQYRKGNHCGMCPRRGECPAIVEWIRQISRAFVGDKVVDLPDDKMEWGPLLKEAFEHCKQLEYNLKDFRAALKATLKKTGPLPLENGESFGVVEKPNEDIDAGLAYQKVTAELQLQPEELLRGMTLSKKSIQEMCLSTAEGADDKVRRKAARQKELRLIAELRAAGACSQSTSDYIEVIP